MVIAVTFGTWTMSRTDIMSLTEGLRDLGYWVAPITGRRSQRQLATTRFWHRAG